MEEMDPYLVILLQDFARLCPDDTAPRQDDWTALNEIALFVHEERIHCTGSDIREHLLQQGVTPSKATICGEQYDRFLQALQRHDRRSKAPARPLDEAGDHRKGTAR
jgi:hypothetical protein